METTSDSSGISNTFYLIGTLLILGFGIWLGIKISSFTNRTRSSNSGSKHPHPQPHPDPHPDPQPHPGPHPHPGPGPGPGPGPQPRPNPARNFNPTLTLNSATLNPTAKEVHVSYQVDSDTPIPPTRTYSVVFTIIMNGKPFTAIGETVGLEQGDLGFPKDELLLTTGIGNVVKGVNMQVKAQIHYHEVGSPASGVVGSPQTIDVS